MKDQWCPGWESNYPASLIARKLLIDRTVVKKVKKKEATVPRRIIISLVVFALGALAQNSLLRASPPGASGQAKPNHKIKPSKYSAELPQGEFQSNQIELAPDAERRQLRESRYKGPYAEVRDPAETDPTGPTEDSVYVISDYAGKIDPLPAYRSATVVIGTVLSGKAFIPIRAFRGTRRLLFARNGNERI